jgi:hypothetical protein
MTLEEFIERHGLKEIDQRDNWVPMDLCAEDDDGEEMEFYVNDARTVGLAVNRTKKLVRVAYAELAPAVSDWVQLSERFECPALA